MNVWAYDPGNVTGVAVGSFADRQPEVIAVHEMTPFAAVRALEAEQRIGDVIDLVVCESFTPRPGVRTWQPDALYTIGALRYVCEREDVPFELQSPADAKRFSTDDKLKALGWHTPSKGGHKNDALRHLLLAAARREAIDLRRLT